MEHHALVNLAFQQLNEAYNANANIIAVEDMDGQHGTILRLHMTPVDGLPQHLVIKQLPKGEARIDPRTRFLGEWAGLKFSSLIATDTLLAPRFLLGNFDEQFIVMEEIRNAILLRDALDDPNAEDTLSLLEDFGTFLAKFHAASYGREDELIAIQQDLGFDAPPRNDSSIDLRDRIAQAKETFAFLGDVVTDEFVEEVHAFSAGLYEDDRFRVFNHHDAGPHNILLVDRKTLFIDFEFSEYGSLFMDFTAPYLAYPPYGRGKPIPSDVLKRYENAYRNTIAPTIPDILNDDIFEQKLHYACGQWMLAKTVGGGDRFSKYFVHGHSDELPEHVTPEMLTNWRRLLFTQIRCFLDLLENTPHIPEIYAVLQQSFDTAMQYQPDLELIPIWSSM